MPTYLHHPFGGSESLHGCGLAVRHAGRGEQFAGVGLGEGVGVGVRVGAMLGVGRGIPPAI